MPPIPRVGTFDLSDVTEGFVKALEAYASFVRAGSTPNVQQKTEAAWARQLFRRMGLTSMPTDFVTADNAAGLREIADMVAKVRTTMEQNNIVKPGGGLGPMASAKTQTDWNKSLLDFVTEASPGQAARTDGPRQAYNFLKSAFNVAVKPPNTEGIATAKFTPSKFSDLPNAIRIMRDMMAEEAGTTVKPGSESIYDTVVLDAARQDDAHYESVYSALADATLKRGGGAAPAGSGGGGPASGPSQSNDDDNDIFDPQGKDGL